ncbi:MAG: GGDEF domain-containing protein [Planctomycetota bacterium]
MVKKSNSIKLLKSSDTFVAFKAGDIIFSEGDEGATMYVIKSGSVELRTGFVIIGIFVTGDLIGEMSLVDQERRSATATAVTDCELVSVDYPRFQTMILEEPDFAIEVMQTMSARLRHMNHETNIFHKRIESTQIQAMTDPLTGANNRRAWDTRLAAEENRCRLLGRTACVVSIDLDGLKFLNDSAGHMKGDELIKKTAQALFEACRDSDVVARLGGDEFGVLAPDCPLESGQHLVKRIEESLAKYDVSASIGLACRNPLLNLNHTWESADQLMYEVKRSRKETRVIKH